MTDSILDSTKKVLGIDPSNTEFDVDIMMHINSVLNTLTDLGIGPSIGFVVDDASALWVDFLGPDVRLATAKTYVATKVRLVFDPPPTSFAIEALQKVAEEAEWRLLHRRELKQWTNPLPVREPADDPMGDLVIDGGTG